MTTWGAAMKRGIFAVGALMCAASATGYEIQSGTVEISGDSSVSADRTVTTAEGSSDATSQSQDFDLSALYYLKKNIGIGLVGNLSRDETTATAGTTGSYISFAGPVAQLAVPLGESTALKLNVAIAAGAGESWAPGRANISYDVRAAVVGVALSYWVTDGASVDVGFSRGNLSLTSDRPLSDNHTSIDWFGVGASIYLQ